MALIELVDFNDIYGKGKGETKETTKKTRRSRATKKTADKAEEATTEGKSEE
jgi:large subunit ribosomal protein L17